ncbi:MULTISPECIES: YitT family protein [Clostridia]|uniref:YitT family protein n=1 Tax=Clostridia TaxID=186801 RepID=UPI00067EDF44|nr:MULTISPECIES: YitT family protein [Clostridia]
MEKRKSLIKSESIAICKIVAGCFLYALSVVLFIDPAKIIPGSVTGIGVVVKALTGFPIGILSIIINVPLVIWGTIVLGKRLLIYTGLTVLLSSSMIDMLAFLKPFTQDVFLASVFGGVVMGVGLGMILDAGGTTGGTTVVGRLVLKKFPHIPMGNILLVGDFIIITVGSLLLKDWDLLLYSIVDLYVCVVVINKVMYGFKISSLSVILTKKGIQVGEQLQKFKGCRVILHSEDKIVAASRKQDVSKIQHIVEDTDGDAACTAFDADYSFGRVYGEYAKGK